MRIEVEDIGKRFQKEWIFKGISIALENNGVYSILGSNGSGKSTFLQVCSGYLTPSSGRISWLKNDGKIEIDKVYKEVALCTPYMTLYDDFTLAENIQFFLSFKKLRNNCTLDDLVELMELSKHRDKLLRNFSSGMKQRVKLSLAIVSQTELLLLDEPSSHLDATSIDWYKKLLSNHLENRITLIASNSEQSDLVKITQSLKIMDYK